MLVFDIPGVSTLDVTFSTLDGVLLTGFPYATIDPLLLDTWMAGPWLGGLYPSYGMLPWMNGLGAVPYYGAPGYVYGLNYYPGFVEAMKGRGSLRLSTSLIDTSVATTIEDSGPGIPKQHLSKIFDPFFTTKGQGEGSGLGLTVARRIIKKFGGDIRIESQEGRGTSCIVTLPLIPPPPPPQEAPCIESQSHSTPQPFPS
jgi:hypothetical protein